MLESETGMCTPPATPLRLRTIRPSAAIDPSTVIMYFHGAGWVMCDETTHDRLVKELAVGATLVFVDYDRSLDWIRTRVPRA
jgi:acetyl esterase